MSSSSKPTPPGLPPGVLVPPLWKRLRHAEPPEVLYHYTKPGAFLSILERREAWATHIRYMNDARELDHGRNLLAECIEDRKGELATRELDLLEAVLDEPAASDTFVFSLSRLGDDLSQWRADGGDGGFSIGFRGNSLRAAAAMGGVLAPCLYDDDDQRALISEFLDFAGPLWNLARSGSMGSPHAASVPTRPAAMKEYDRMPASGTYGRRSRLR